MSVVSFRMDKHPAECGGGLEGCLHCQGAVTDDHDPRSCAFCEEDWLVGLPYDLLRLVEGRTYDEMRDAIVLLTLATQEWNRRAAARRLGVPLRTFHRWIAAIEDARGGRRMPLPRPALTAKCLIAECSAPASCRGMCKRHYGQDLYHRRKREKPR